MSLSAQEPGVVHRSERDDAALLRATREGDLEAYGLLFERHFDAATRLAHSLVPGPNADDLVAEAFSRVLATLQRGGGPTEFFRAYVLTTIRRQHIDSLRHTSREQPTEDEKLDAREEFVDTAERGFEHAATAQAFASLPERWQLVLWHLDVEGQRPADIAPMLDMSPNAVSALAYRAREGLRQAYLQSHVQPSTNTECSDTIGRLGAYVRKGLAKRDRAKVDAHLDECRSCLGLMNELREFNEGLGGILAPALLGSSGAGYLASLSISASGGGLLASSPREFSAAAGSTTTAGAAVSTGAATGIIGAVTALAPAGVAAAVVFIAGAAGLATTESSPNDRDAIVAITPAPTSDYSPPTSSPVVDESEDEMLSLVSMDQGSGSDVVTDPVADPEPGVPISRPNDDSDKPGTDGPGAGDDLGTGYDPGAGEDPGTSNPVAGDDPDAGDPGTGDLGTPDNPGTDDDPGESDDPGTDDPGTDPDEGGPGTGDPAPGDDPGTDDSGTGDPGTGDPGAGDEPGGPGAGDPGAGDEPGTGDNPGTPQEPNPDDPGFCEANPADWPTWLRLLWWMLCSRN